jgi:polyisoprenyl-phosphate glycosyltransferase
VRFWIVTPVYRDVESFSILRERLLAVLMDEPESEAEARFIVLDDSAGFDPEISQLMGLGDVTVLQPPFNLGHQRAIVYALRRTLPEIADEDVVITLDADGEDQPEDLPRMLAALRAGDGDKVVLALRTKRRESLSFKAMYRLFRLMFRALTGTTVRSGNYAVVPGAIARRMIAHPSFDLSYSSTMLAVGLPVELVPCERGERYRGQSKMTFGRLATHGVRMLMPFTDRIAIRALAVFAVALFLGIALAVVVLSIKLFTSNAVPGWASFTALGAVIVSLVALGNFVTLFILFSQTRAISLSSIEEAVDGRSPSAPGRSA